MTFTIAYPRATIRDFGQHRLPWASGAQPSLIVLHTMVGYLSSTDRMWQANAEPAGSHVFSHFGVGGVWGDGLDGTIYQWGDLAYRSAAQVAGNPYGVSIETGDNAPQTPAEIEAWTPKQLDSLTALCAWLCSRFDIPAHAVSDPFSGARGITWHQAGGESWGGHECPGPVREGQIVDVLVPAVNRLLAQPDGPVERSISLHVIDTQVRGVIAGHAQGANRHAMYLNDALRTIGYEAPAAHNVTDQTVHALVQVQEHLGVKNPTGVIGMPGLEWIVNHPACAWKGYSARA